MPRRPGTHVDDSAAVGSRLRAARKRAGLSQRELAFEGCTPAYISRIEAGERVPSLQILREFAKRLDTDVEYLAGRRTERTELDLLNAELEVKFGQLDRAQKLYESLRRTTSSPSVHARAVAGLGFVALRTGDHEEGVVHLEHALADNSLPPAEGAHIADALGRAYAFLGEFESALAVYERYLAAAQERKDFADTIRFSVLLANALIDNGKVDRATELVANLVAELSGETDPLVRAQAFWTQSRLHMMHKRTDLAERYARRAVDLLRLTDEGLYEAQAFQLAAHIEIGRGAPEEAMALLERGAPLVSATRNKFQVALFELERARALLALGRHDEAAAQAIQAGTALSEAGPAGAGRAYALLAETFRALGDLSRALELYELAAETLQSQDRYLVDVYSAIADIHEAQGRHEDAVRILKRALEARLHGGRRRPSDDGELDRREPSPTPVANATRGRRAPAS